ncbi:MAG: bifunctional (p)ppGpp synthetase/guanosine-3',5'-bis(diphosphate) 3'-pyrophosphohydrolase [Candidatus Faecousia sp.]|nr:bifunctional (p)ppGpp synthetase/guanosine-3',5'-bis(diphosphate) 3'-pyrophosphohydrolase [Clostridiales bacterium]MCI6935115.1 bifunctional (p)ppGpp synthetase/guanosine-3',5'-bis(diphosphate) 3'-pyrophosphohydrolase [Clostridiales bacterium]MDD5883162.1 bifunctional (p)ppGpp synthetase/guanosine-3',5'-bis(diphosphate) 3'-pyrophosphohydrolase [Bacillota bacterium]MDY4598376.1 bifunctional (p)ppGpp synthetase/guanosine-3',5'-bis(diphosphate) 3'-pyrophosphohydrolase [Candidatus Faecousia sp.]
METFEEHYAAMQSAILKRMPGADMQLIDKAVDYANVKHKLQKRKDGSPYIIHPLAVAQIVAEMGLDQDAVLGALLHDCIEDTDASHEEIEKIFGTTVAELVEGVTKLTRANFSTSEQEQMENLRKMFMAMSKDIRVVLIKIADRLHNMRTMQYQTPEKQIKKCRETMDIYAPLAHRLGMQKIKWELEDIALRYLAPDSYNEIMNYLNAHKEQDEVFMRTIQDKITQRLSSVGIHNKTYGRIKHVYSIYRKMQSQGKTIDELYDIYAFRVIVDSIPDCYNVLGHVHDLFNLVPGRFKDYISTPKPNMYQSLHTTVIGSQGIPFEVQIRTWEMHETAEYGIAAHWKYKQGTGAGTEKDFEWVRRLLETQQDSDAEEFVQDMKIDMFDDEVFVYTPKGRIVSLPAGSTPIDFAYAIHSGVGNAMIGAKVNNRIANIDTKLRNGDIVEVLTSKSAKGPSRDWLTICKSNQARTKIKQWFKKEKREENILHGRASFEAEMKRVGLPLTAVADPELEPHLLKKLAFDSWDDMYAAIGYGGLTATKAVGRIRDDVNKAVKAQAAEKLPVSPLRVRPDSDADLLNRHAVNGVIVEDIDSCMIKFAKCCTPVPGDAIVGFITKGFGVSIHRADCPNAANRDDPRQAARWVRVRWATQEEQPFETTLELDCITRDGLVLDVATVMTTARVRVKELNAKDLPGGRSTIIIRFEVKNVAELDSIRKKLLSIRDVTNSRRGQN